MVDYSRFDHIDIEDDEEDDLHHTSVNHTPVKCENTDQSSLSVKMSSTTKEGRIKFEYEGRLIYEWDQSLDECNIYIKPPEGVTKNVLDISITHNHLRVGLKGSPPFIDENTFSIIVADESYWMLSDGELNINLQKMKKGEVIQQPICIFTLKLINFFFNLYRHGIIFI